MTQANFGNCLAFTLKYEGGKSNDPHDPGGRTMEGVTQATYDHYRAMKAFGPKNVFMMSDSERDEIYRNQYWDRVSGDGLRAGEDLCIFDFAVNSGPGRALDIWRRCGGAKVKIDDLIHGICAYRLSFLQALRTWKYFGGGWGRRVAACEALAVRMAHGSGAKEALAKKAAEASRNSGKKTTQAAVGTAASGGAAVANHAHTGNTMLILGAGIIIAFMAAVLLFRAWRQRQRAAAFAEEVKK